MYTKFAMKENDVGKIFALSSKHIYTYISSKSGQL